MAKPLEGTVAAITGASSGIGEATALALADAGAAVALGARRLDRIEAAGAERDRIEALADRIDSAGGRALAFQVDVAEEQAANAFVAAAHERLGGLHVLVNNAGVMLLGPVAGADTEHWRRMIDVNLLGLLYCTHAALPLMGEGGGGHVVNLSSVAGRHARAGAAVYNMTKFGVTAFSEALRQEALHANVRVTCVEPGFVETELQGHNRSALVQQGVKKMREQIGEVLQAEDIAETIRYVVCQPPHVAINEILVRPTRQQG